MYLADEDTKGVHEMTRPHLFRRCAGIVAGVGAALWPAIAFADDCSSELDCQQTPAYNTTTTVIGTAIAVGVAVISILVSSSTSRGDAATGPDANAGDGGDGDGGADGSPDSSTLAPSSGEILDGDDAIDWLSDNGLIAPVVNPDGSVTWQPTSPDFPGDHPDMPGIVWTEGDDGSILEPVIFINPDGSEQRSLPPHSEPTAPSDAQEPTDQRPDDKDKDEDEGKDEDKILLELTYPAGTSPNVFTTGWLFGALAVADPGGPGHTPLSNNVEWSGSGTFVPAIGNRSRPTFAGPGPNTIELTVTYEGRTLTRRFSVNAVSPFAYAHVGSRATAPADADGCPACPHSVAGPIKTGSPTVHINGLPAARLGDSGVHAACCGPNSFEIIGASGGAEGVFIDGRPAVKLGDQTRHCGGMGTIDVHG